MKRVLGWLLVAGVVVVPAAALAHARLVTPAPRNNQDGYKDPLLVPACGVARNGSQPVTDFAAGTRVQVEFEETVNHSGCFVLDISVDNDQTWTQLAVVQHDTSQPTPRPYDTFVDLPAGVTCTQCTMRLRQLMVADNGCPPANVPSGATYHTCANIRLVGPAVDAGTGTPDAAQPDAARPDAGAPDAARADAAVPLDAGRADAGSPGDAGRVDAGSPGDAGRVDAGTPSDAGRLDAGRPLDAGRVDAGGRDAAVVVGMDGGDADAAASAADGAVDTGDAAGAAVADGAQPLVENPPSRCSCATPAHSPPWGVMVLLGLAAVRRRRLR